MASQRNRKSSKVTRTGSNAPRIQKQINQDYTNFFRDYKKLGVELLRKPMTPYILSGVALTVAVPFILSMFRREDVVTFVRDNVDNIRNRIEGYIHTEDIDMDPLNQ